MGKETERWESSYPRQAKNGRVSACLESSCHWRNCVRWWEQPCSDAGGADAGAGAGRKKKKQQQQQQPAERTWRAPWRA